MSKSTWKPALISQIEVMSPDRLKLYYGGLSNTEQTRLKSAVKLYVAEVKNDIKSKLIEIDKLQKLLASAKIS